MASKEREKDYYRYTPLHSAVMARRAAMVRRLVKIMHHGMREKDQYGNMPLHMAAMRPETRCDLHIGRQGGAQP
jgi:hypothetical protein